MLEIDKNNFKSEVLASEKPILLDFWSTSCGPCRSLDPILRSVEGKVDNVKFAKIEVDGAMDVFGEYKVTYVPTMIIFKDGKELDRKGGLMKEEDIINWLKEKAN